MIFINEGYERYAREHTDSESPLLKKLVEETREKFGEAARMQVGRIEGAFLKMLVKVSKAKHVLEIGTFTGYSALTMAEGLPKDGELITLDIDTESTAIAQKFWNDSPHGSKIKLILGPALETISKLSGEFDLAFIDADKKNYLNYWNLIVPKIRSGGTIVVDNVLWSLGDVINPETPHDKAIAAFNDHAAKDSRVETVMLTVRDGITIAIKK